MGEAEVIQEQFLSVCGYNPSEYQRETTGNANLSTDLPRDNATWFEAVRDCKRLSEMQTERKQGNSYRLPTEAEREYVCRAGTKMPFSFGGFKKLRGQEA